jgi:PAS domain S-box-containing protein
MLRALFQKWSIYSTVGLIIVVVISSTVGLHTWVAFKQIQHKVDARIKVRAERSIDLLKRNVSDLISSFSVGEYERLLTIEMDRENIFAIVIEDRKMGEVMGRGSYLTGQIRNPDGIPVPYKETNLDHVVWLKTCYHTLSHDVTDVLGRRIGSITVCISDREIREELDDMLLFGIITVISIVLILSSALFILIHLRLLKPLATLNNTIYACDGVPARVLPEIGPREIAALAQTINRMIRAVRTSRESLHKAKEQLELALWGSGDGSWHWDIPGGRATFDRRWTEMLGYENTEIPGTYEGWASLIHPDQFDDVIRQLQAHLAGTTPEFEVTLQMRTRSGQWKWVLSRGKVVKRAADGTPLEMAGTHSDIDNAKTLEQQLKENEQRFRTFFEDNSSVMLMLEPMSGAIIEANKAALEFYGFDHETLTSMNITQINTIPPEQSAAIRLDVLSGGSKQFTFVHRLASGALRSVEVHYSPVEINGQISLFTIIHDITERKQAENALQQERQRLANIIEGTRAGTWEWNVQTGETIFNECWADIIGYTLNELGPVSIRTWIRLVHPQDVKKSRALLASHFAGQLPYYESEARMRHREGHWVWVLGRGRVISWTEDGKPLWMFGTHSDITRSKQAEADLLHAKIHAEDANRAKSDFLASMSHEIRTPMNVIVGMGELLMEGETDTTRRHYLESLNSAAEGLLSLINNVLDLSKIESGNLTLNPVPFDLSHMLHAIERIFEHPAHNKGVAFSTHMAPGLPASVLGDVTRIRQVLVNLVGNALKFTSNGSVRVAIEPEDAGGMVRFRVTDTGIGIGQNNLDVIFEPFTQADGTITRRFGGTGLGLSICKRIVSHMGGEISVTSSPGSGSEFCFAIPLPAVHGETGQQDVHDRRSTDSARPVQATQALRVLIVDDSEDNLNLMAAYLKSTPHEVIFVQDGYGAVRACCSEERFDLVLMDVQMPEMDGYTATRKIRTWEQELGRVPMPIWALSAHAFSQARESSREAGCDGHLTKPIRKRELLAFLDQVAGPGVF